MTTDRKNITQPADWWAAFEAQSQAEGMSLSEWMGNRCRRYLPYAVRKELSERKTKPGRKPKETSDE